MNGSAKIRSACLSPLSGLDLVIGKRSHGWRRGLFSGAAPRLISGDRSPRSDELDYPKSLAGSGVAVAGGGDNGLAAPE